MQHRADSAKSVTRREFRHGRRLRDAESAEVAAAGLAGHLLAALAGRTGPVATYLSRPGEPGTGALRARLAALGHPVLLPVLLGDGGLDWVQDDAAAGPSAHADPLRPAGPRLGPAAVWACQLVLLPALAVDAAGTRLGQGGGSYDRALAGHDDRRVPLLLAVVHTEELLGGAVLPRETHDVPVHGALTPDGVHRFDAGDD